METKTPAEDTAWQSRLDLALLVSAILVMVAAVGLLIYTVSTQVGIYQRATVVALANLDHPAVLAYARAGDFAAAKFGALFLGFALIFLGSAYTLRIARIGYELKIGHDDQQPRASLSTSSPGLVMVSLGVVLVLAAVLTQSTVNLRPLLPNPIIFETSEDTAN